MATMSPSRSPRLPSPPPIAEDQLGPKSPISNITTEQGILGAAKSLDNGASRRIRPGTKVADIPEGPPLVETVDIDAAFQHVEHLKALYNAAIHPEGTDTTVPIDRATAIRLATAPKDVDRAIWLYELCRFLCQKVNLIIIALFADEPPCSAQTCNEMRASEWQYLCAVHDPPKPCCAIDYCCHTLDWAANVLTSPKHFPSRLALGTEQGTSHQQMRQLTNIFRRVYRIFAHAWFQHRAMFWQVEGRTGLYIFFKTVCDVYGLIPEDNYTVPPEAEGGETEAEGTETRPSILQRNNVEERHSETTGNEGQASSEHPKVLAVGNVTISTGHTTKRHRQTPSVDAGAISTVIEEIEEEDPKGDKTMPTPEEKHTEPGKEDSMETGQAGEESKVVNPNNSEPDIEVAEEPLLNRPPEAEEISKETTTSSASDEPALTSVVDPGNEAKPEENKTKNSEPEDSVIAEKLMKAEEPADHEDPQPLEEKAPVEVTDLASKTETPTTGDTPKETDAASSESDGKEKVSEVSKS